MHLLIDIRSSCPSDIPFVYYGIDWGELWKKYHPHDRITFLTYEGEELSGHECVTIPRGFRLFPKKIAAHERGPDRIISFSPLTTIDTGIPSILHLGEFRDDLYSENGSVSFSKKLSRYFREYSYKKSRALIVPWREVGIDMIEMHDFPDEKIHILPYLNIPNRLPPEKKAILTYGLSEEYYITEVTPTEEWQPLELIQQYAHYIHDHKGKEELILLGDLGKNFGMLVALIRSLDLLQKVKILGVIEKSERESLYSSAKGWIALGRYYSRGPSLTLAIDYKLPLFLSPIPGLRGYAAHYIHPSDPSSLIEGLKKELKHRSGDSTDNEQMMHLYARIIAS